MNFEVNPVSDSPSDSASIPRFLMVHGAQISNKMGRPHRAWINVADIVSIEEGIAQTAIDPDHVEWIKICHVMLRGLSPLEVREPFDYLSGQIQLISAGGNFSHVWGPYQDALNEWDSICEKANGNPYILADTITDADDDESDCVNPLHDHGSFGNLPDAGQSGMGMPGPSAPPAGGFYGTPDQIRAQMIATGMDPEVVDAFLGDLLRGIASEGTPDDESTGDGL